MTLLQPPSRPIKTLFYFPSLKNTPTTTSEGCQGGHMTRLWIFLKELAKNETLIQYRPAGGSQSFYLPQRSVPDLENSDPEEL